MAKKRKDQNIEKGFGSVEGALSKSEQFIEKHQKKLSYAVIGILLIITAIFAYNKYILKPNELNAQNNIFVAQHYFNLDSFELALNGDGNYDGFLDVIDEYSGTKAGNLAKYYAGLCYRKLGNYEEAINYFEDFSPGDFHLSSLKYSVIGDCLLELKRLEEAAENYLKASTISPNNYSTPIYLFRAGLVFQKLENYDRAIEVYERIEKEFPQSLEAHDIQIYISRANKIKQNTTNKGTTK